MTDTPNVNPLNSGPASQSQNATQTGSRTGEATDMLKVDAGNADSFRT